MSKRSTLEPATAAEPVAASGRDVTLAVLAGFLSGVFAIPIVLDVGVNVRLPLPCLPIAAAIAFGLAIYAAQMLTRRVRSLFQFAKFVAIGVLNSAIDFGGLNFLMLATGVASGTNFLAFKSISVTVAVINSYLWNKYWTFNGRGSVNSRRELGAFLIVTLICIALNVAAAEVIVNVIGAPHGVRPELWANFGALSAAVVTLFANFFGYKFFVFTTPLSGS